MGIRKEIADSITSIKKARTLGTRKIKISEPLSYEFDDDEQLIFSSGNYQKTHRRLSPLTSPLFRIPSQGIIFPRTIEKLDVQIGAQRESFPIDIQVDALQPIFIDLEIDFSVQKSVLWFVDVEVSANIFISLKDSLVKGKKFIENEWKNAFKKVTSKKTRKPKSRDTHTFQIPLTKEEDSSDTTSKSAYVPSFFDLIKPLLLPPPDIFTNDDPFLPPGKRPYKYQHKGIEKLVENRSFLLADENGNRENGNGNTGSSNAFRRTRGDIRRVLILCPVKVFRVWEKSLI